MAKFRIEIDLENASFENNPAPEIIRILTALCRRMDRSRETTVYLWDINGNMVGKAEYKGKPK